MMPSNKVLPSNITVASFLTDSIHRSGLVSSNTSQHLFDVLADALATELPLCQVVVAEIEFASEALSLGFLREGDDA